jgi:hypothetical protein
MVLCFASTFGQGSVQIVHSPTKRAPDVWDSAAFSSILLASGLSCSQTKVHACPYEGNANRLTNADTSEVTDLAGMPLSTRVRDNGTSANSAPDQVGYSVIGEGFASSCEDQVDEELWDAPKGLAKVR